MDDIEHAERTATKAFLIESLRSCGAVVGVVVPSVLTAGVRNLAAASGAVHLSGWAQVAAVGYGVAAVWRSGYTTGQERERQVHTDDTGPRDDKILLSGDTVVELVWAAPAAALAGYELTRWGLPGWVGVLAGVVLWLAPTLVDCAGDGAYHRFHNLATFIRSANQDKPTWEA